MPWFRVDDRFPFHPKVIDAGNAAIGAWVRIGADCSAHLTDGLISDARVRLMASEAELADLLRVRMIVRVEGGYQLHQYLAYQPSKQEVEEQREFDRDRQRKKRVRKSTEGDMSRVTTRVTEPVTPQGVLVWNGSESVSASGSSGESAERGELPGKPTDALRRVVDRWRDTAELVLNALNDARKRVRPSSRGISPTYDSLGHIAERLEAGKSATDCLHVVEVCEAECHAEAQQFKWFDAVTPFVAKNFERKSAADPGLIIARGVVADHRAKGRGHARATASYAVTSDGTDDL